MGKMKMATGGVVLGGALGIGCLIGADTYVAESTDIMSAIECASQLPEKGTAEVTEIPNACEQFATAYDTNLSSKQQTYELANQEEFLVLEKQAIHDDEHNRKELIVGAGIVGAIGGLLIGALYFRPSKHRLETRVSLDVMFGSPRLR